jgi:hypothetical protein
MHRPLPRHRLSCARTRSPRPRRTLIALSLFLILGTTLACSVRDYQAVAQPSADVPIAHPAIFDFQVYADAMSVRHGGVLRDESLTACFSMTPGASRGFLMLAITAGSTPPRSAYAPDVIGRSDVIGQRERRDCYFVRVTARAPSDQEYTVWLLHGADILAQKSFRVGADGPTLSPAPPLVSSPPATPPNPEPAAAESAQSDGPPPESVDGSPVPPPAAPQVAGDEHAPGLAPPAPPVSTSRRPASTATPAPVAPPAPAAPATPAPSLPQGPVRGVSPSPAPVRTTAPPPVAPPAAVPVPRQTAAPATAPAAPPPVAPPVEATATRPSAPAPPPTPPEPTSTVTASPAPTRPPPRPPATTAPR